MPLAILSHFNGKNVTILKGETDAEVVFALRRMVNVEGIDGVEAIRSWLLTQPAPSGWFNTVAEARAAVQQQRRQDQMSADELSHIRAELGQARARFAEELGFQGSANTRHKQIWEMEKGRKPILPERARVARALLALHKLESMQGQG